MTQKQPDPVYRSSCREAIVVFLLFGAAITYTVTYCALYGYGRSMADLTFVLGFPDWIFWGVITPWSVCIVLSYVFAMFFMKDEDIGEDPDEANSETGGDA